MLRSDYYYYYYNLGAFVKLSLVACLLCEWMYLYLGVDPFDLLGVW